MESEGGGERRRVGVEGVRKRVVLRERVGGCGERERWVLGARTGGHGERDRAGMESRRGEGEVRKRVAVESDCHVQFEHHMLKLSHVTSYWFELPALEWREN